LNLNLNLDLDLKVFELKNVLGPTLSKIREKKML
jgi:hypothetical protein